MAYRIPRPRDQFQATVATYEATAATLDPLTYCARPGIKSASWSYRGATDPVVPQQELPILHFLDMRKVFCYMEFLIWPTLGLPH